MSSLIRKYPLPSFFVLAYAVSWLLWLPLAAAQLGWLGPVSPYWHLVGSIGPMTAALIVAAVVFGRSGLERLWRGMTRWRVRPGWWGVAVLGPVVAMLLALAIARLMGSPWPAWRALTRVAEYPQLGFVALLLAEVVFYGFGEEVGWRGFALPWLQRRFSALWASVLLSVGWALWHLPLLFVTEGYRQMGPLMLLGLYFSFLTGAILLTWLFNATEGSLLLLALFHGVLDVAMVNEGLNLQAVNLMGMLITLWGLAAVWLVLRVPKIVWDVAPRPISGERRGGVRAPG